MVVRKRLRDYSSDSNSDRFKIRHKGRTMPSSPVRRMHEEDVFAMEAMLRRIKQQKTTPKTLVSSSSTAKRFWTKNDALIILGSIVDYEKETKLSYRSDWDAFYGYMKDFIETDFSKKQLIDKIRHLKKRFFENQARFNNGKGLSFTDTEDDDIFKLSIIIWDPNETECASNENIDKAEDVPSGEHERVDENMDQARIDVPYVEHEQVNANVDQENDVPSVEHGQVNENMDQEESVPYSEGEPVSNLSFETDNGEKKKNEEDAVDEFYALQDALEATTWFQSVGKYQQKKMIQNLKTLGAQRRKELAGEWKALLAEEMKLYAKKLTFSAKLASA